MPDEKKLVVSRREPTVTTVEVDGKKLRFEAQQIPRWRARNDAGNAIVQMYVTAMNSFVHGYEKDGEYLLEGQMFEAAMDYPGLFERFYPEGSKDDFELLDFDAMIAVLDAALEVNGLERQSYMLDPRKKDQRMSEIQVQSKDADGEKMESSPASG